MEAATFTVLFVDAEIRHLNRLFRAKTWLASCAVLTTLVAGRPVHAGEMEDARDALTSFEWVRAYNGFTAIAAKAPAKSEEWAQATFGAASASSNLQPASEGNTKTSVKLYESILSETPQSKYAPRAMMNLGRLQELRDYPSDKPDLDAAAETYLKVASTWPTLPIASEATLRAAAAYVQWYDAPDFVKVKKGVSLLESWLASHPNDPWASIMYQYLGDTYYMPLGDTAKVNGDKAKRNEYYAKAIAAYEKVDSLGWTDNGNQGPVLWRVAVISETIGNLPTAIKYYTKNIIETPNSGKAYESQLALKRLGAPAPEIQLRKVRSAAPTTREAVR